MPPRLIIAENDENKREKKVGEKRGNLGTRRERERVLTLK